MNSRRSAWTDASQAKSILQLSQAKEISEDDLCNDLFLDFDRHTHGRGSLGPQSYPVRTYLLKMW